MAIVTVSIADALPIATKWEMPANYEGIRSPIPRGIVTYSGTNPIATLSAGDETSYKLTLTMPPGFAYLLKTLHMRFISDDLVNNFNNIAQGFYGRAVDPIDTEFVIQTPGEAIIGAVVAFKLYGPIATTPKLLLLGDDTIGCRLADMDAGGSTAGDVLYYWQFYVFDVDQVDKWEVNTPIPTISHTSF